MSKIGATSLSQLKGKLSTLRNEVSSLQSLKPLYSYVFELFRDRGTSHQLMKFEVAELVWGQLFVQSVFPYIKQWLEYLKEYQKDLPLKRPITKDVWNMFFEFVTLTTKDKAGVGKVIEEGVWPLMIEGFAKYLEAKLA